MLLGAEGEGQGLPAYPPPGHLGRVHAEGGVWYTTYAVGNLPLVKEGNHIYDSLIGNCFRD